MKTAINRAKAVDMLNNGRRWGNADITLSDHTLVVRFSASDTTVDLRTSSSGLYHPVNDASLSACRLLDCLVEVEHLEDVTKFGCGGIVREITEYVEVTQDTQVARQRVAVVKVVRELIGKHGFSLFLRLDGGRYKQKK